MSLESRWDWKEWTRCFDIAVFDRVPLCITPNEIRRLYLEAHGQCAVCGAALRPSLRASRRLPLLFRMIPSRGYLPQNLIFTCLLCYFRLLRLWSWASPLCSGEEPHAPSPAETSECDLSFETRYEWDTLSLCPYSRVSLDAARGCINCSSL